MSPRVKLEGVWGPSSCGNQVKMGKNGVLYFEVDKVGKRSFSEEMVMMLNSCVLVHRWVTHCVS